MNGIIVRKGRMYPDKKNPEQARKFIALLRELADESDKKSAAVTPYRAELLQQHARQARRDADRLENLLPQEKPR